MGVKESESIAFEVFLHLGTLVAVIVYFRITLWELFISLFHWRPTIENQPHRHNRLLIVYLGIATIATFVFYVIFKNPLKALYDNPLIVAGMLSLTGTIVYVSDYVKDRGIPAFSMGALRSIVIGLAQGIAIIPGISRSGTTIACSIFTGVKRKDAARFSFLLSIPAILAASVSELEAFSKLDNSMWVAYIAGFIAAFLSGYLVIAILIRMIQASKLKYFAYYCWTISLVSVVAIIAL